MVENQEVVNEEVLPQEEVTIPEVTEEIQLDEATPEEVVEPPKAGDKTDPNLLLKSLQSEREARRKLEEEIELLKSSTSPEDLSDEGKALALRIARLEADKVKEDVVKAYPILKDKLAEVEEFQSRPENSGMSLQAAAKVYLAENGLLAGRRVGAEKTTGGQRTPASSSMSVEDLENLRKNSPRKYADMLAKGQIKF